MLANIFSDSSYPHCPHGVANNFPLFHVDFFYLHNIFCKLQFVPILGENYFFVS